MVSIHSSARASTPQAQVARPLPTRAPGLVMLDGDRMERRGRNPFSLSSVRKPRWAGGVPPWQELHADGRPEELDDELEQGDAQEG